MVSIFVSLVLQKNRNRQSYPKEESFGIFLDFCDKHDYIPLSTIDEYENQKTTLKYYCKLHGEKTITLSQIKHSSDTSVGCRECSYKIISEKLNKSISEVISIVESKGNKLLNPDDYISVKVPNLKIKCGTCGETFITSLKSQMCSDGACIECGVKKVSKQLTLTADDLNKLYNQDQITLLNPEEYINNSTLNLKFKCSECGEPFVTSKANYDCGTKKCSKCIHTKSSGETLIEDYLIKHELNYQFQYRFNDCRDIKPLPFDFYLPDLNTVIEFDGQQHYEPAYGEEKFKRTKLHDAIKNEYCFFNDIKIIRIPYFDGHKIAEILDNELNI